MPHATTPPAAVALWSDGLPRIIPNGYTPWDTPPAPAAPPPALEVSTPPSVFDAPVPAAQPLAPPLPAEPVTIKAEDQVPWVRSIARKELARNRVYGWCEVDDVTSDGVIELLRKWPQFVPPPGVPQKEAFRGWVFLWIKKACERGAERIVNGGTYHARRQVRGRRPVIAEPFSDHVTPNSGDSIDPASYRDTGPNAYALWLNEALH